MNAAHKGLLELLPRLQKDNPAIADKFKLTTDGHAIVFDDGRDTVSMLYATVITSDKTIADCHMGGNRYPALPRSQAFRKEAA